MSTNLIPFDAGDLPAHLREQFGENANSELAGGVSGGYPIISYKGKVFHINEGDTKTLVARPGEEDVPAPFIEVVIVRANPHLSKVFYPKGYEEGTNEKPTCYSNDGRAPALDASEPQCATCAACPHNAWGSRITEQGSKGKACSDSRRMAVVPGGELERVMLLRVPAATLKDLAQYADTLSRRKAPYQAVLTRIGFDHTVAHPKFTFKPVRWLTAEEAATIRQTMEKDIVEQIIGSGSESAVDALGAPPAHVKAIAAPQTAPAKAAAPKVAQAVQPKTAPPKAKPAPAKHVSEEDVDAAMSGAEAPTPAPKPAPKSPKAALLSEADSELDAVLAELDD